jgi:hypothetical protein
VRFSNSVSIIFVIDTRNNELFLIVDLVVLHVVMLCVGASHVACYIVTSIIGVVSLQAANVAPLVWVSYVQFSVVLAPLGLRCFTHTADGL